MALASNGGEWGMLVEFAGEAIRQQWPLSTTVVRVGRWPDNDIVVDDRWVSRYHAEVRREGNQYVLRDLGSKNGTYVNGRRLSGPHHLIDGDQICVAPLHVLTFVDYAATAPLPGQRTPALEMDAETREVRIWGRPLDPPLSQIQYDFLALLAREPGRVFTRDELVAAVWPTVDPTAISDDAVNALVHRLRQRLHELEPERELLVTVRGYGFKLDLP